MAKASPIFENRQLEFLLGFIQNVEFVVLHGKIDLDD
jgi:hypothetical protein